MSQDMVKRGITAAMADRFGSGMDAAAFERTLMATVMPSGSTREQVAAFLMVCNQHGLNPFTREVYAFPDKGGIRPIVSIDGWATLVNNHPQYDGCSLEEVWDEAGKLVAVECVMHRKDRRNPLVIREYLSECFRGTEPWKRWPARMLRHKAFIQAARLAFAFSGISDEDEVERAVEAQAVEPERKVTQRVRIEAARVVPPQDPAGGQSLVQPEPAPEPVQPEPAPEKSKRKPKTDSLGWPVPEEGDPA